MNRCSATVIIKKNKKGKKDSLCPLYHQFFINKMKCERALGIKVSIENWDSDKEKIKGKSQEDIDNQLLIDAAKSKFTQINIRYRLNEAALSKEKFLDLYDGKASDVDFIKFYEYEMNSRFQLNVISEKTYNQNKTTLVKLKLYKPYLPFTDITVKFLQEFDAWHHKRLLKWSKSSGKELVKNGLNARGHALKNIRTYINIALDTEGINFINPFKSKQIKVFRVEGSRIYLNKEEVRALVSLYKSKKLPVWQKRHLLRFLISCFTGLRVSDSKQVTEMPITNNKLIFTPQKTERRGKILELPLSKTAAFFIQELKNDLDYKPISDQDFNRELKKIMPYAQIYKKITTHSGRHTFGYLFIKQRGNVEVLRELMGHSDIRTTMIYVHLAQEDKQEQINQMDSIIDFD